MSCIICYQHYAGSVRDAVMVFPSFQHFHVDGRISVDEHFFFSETEGKKSPCSKISGYLTLSADAGRMSLLKVYSTAVTCNGFKASSRYLITQKSILKTSRRGCSHQVGWNLVFSIEACHVFFAGYLSYIQHSDSCLRRHLVTWSIDSKHSPTTPPLPIVYPRFIIHFARLILPLFVDDRLTFAGLPRMRSMQSFTETLTSNKIQIELRCAHSSLKYKEMFHSGKIKLHELVLLNYCGL